MSTERVGGYRPTVPGLIFLPFVRSDLRLFLISLLLYIRFLLLLCLVLGLRLVILLLLLLVVREGRSRNQRAKHHRSR